MSAKNGFHLAISLALLMLSLTGVTTVAAQQAEYELQYFEDFEGESLEGWQLSGCEVVGLDGNRVLGCTGSSIELVRFPSLALIENYWLDEAPFVIRFDFKTSGGRLKANVKVDPDFQDGGHYIGQVEAGEGRVRGTLLRQWTAEEVEIVNEGSSTSFDTKRWYQVEISIHEGGFSQRIYLDGNQVQTGLAYEDEQTVSPGLLAFQMEGGEIYIDNIEIWRWVDIPPQEELGNIFSGQVHLVESENRILPLEGVQVALFGANNPFPAEGDFLGEFFTDQVGYFEIYAPEGYEFYNLRLLDTRGFMPYTARSIGGIIQEIDWIQHVLPLDDEKLSTNEFFIVPLEQEESILAGRVVVGEPGGELEPLEGITVALFGAFDPYPAEGEYLADVATGPDGLFEFFIPGDYEYYSLHLISPEDYLPIAAESRAGVVRGEDWIESVFPFDDLINDGNQFFVQYQEPGQPGEPAWNFPRCEAGEFLLAANDFLGSDTNSWGLGEGWWTESNQLLTDMRTFARHESPGFIGPHVRVGALLAEEGNGLEIILEDDSGRFYYYLVEPGAVSMSKVIGGEEVHYDSQGILLETNQWFELEAGASDGRMWIAIDGETVLEAADVDPLFAGTLTLATLDTGVVAIDVFWVCGQGEFSPPVVSPPPPPCFLGIICGPEDWILTIVILLVLGGLLWGGGRMLFRGPGDPTKPGKLLPPTPGLPPIRLANAWLSQGTGGQGKTLRGNFTLSSGDSYTLHVQIQPRQKAPRDGDVPTPTYPLDVVFFYLDDEFSPGETRSISIEMPADGASPEARLDLQPLKTGTSRVRIGIYHQNVLLQSVYLDMRVEAKRRRRGNAILRGIDYVASSRFIDLDKLGSPQLSIFTNENENKDISDRWVGLFSNIEISPDWLKKSAVHQFSASLLREYAENARKTLSKISGEKKYTMEYPLPMDAVTLNHRVEDLVELAKSGAKLFTALFITIQGDLDMDFRYDLRDFLAEPESTISIARLRDDGTSFPWSAMYSYSLDTSPEPDICPVFKSWLETQGEQPAAQPAENLLDDPQACRARAECPLSGDMKYHTVCPFGFWGFMHKIEQPLKLVKPVSIDTVPKELMEPKYEATSRIDLAPGERIRMDMAEYSDFTILEAHQENLAQLIDRAVLDLTHTDDRQVAMRMLTEGGRHLVYFFCHGDVLEKEFTLQVGTEKNPGNISARSLNLERVKWPSHPQTLVFLNGCESLAFTPENVHGFLGMLSGWGASGVIGVEIKNWSSFAAPFAEGLYRELFAGSKLGDAFLNTRREFLRRGNPLGLVYSLHGQARLHLHPLAGCSHCAEVELARNRAENTIVNDSGGDHGGK